MFVYAAFNSEASAEMAHTTLLDHSFPDEDIHAILDQGGIERELPLCYYTGVAIGATAGALLGALVAVLASAALMGISSQFGVLVIGLVIGGVLGALAGLGFWAERIDFSRDHLADGLVLVGVVTRPQREYEARRALRKSGATRVMYAHSVDGLPAADTHPKAQATS